MAKAFDLKRDCDEIVAQVKSASWFPFKTGNLKNNATSGTSIDDKTYLIKFDGQIAPYIKQLEEGRTRKKYISTQSISRTVRGIGVPFHYDASGVQSSSAAFKVGKHIGFISDKTISLILDYFVIKYKGEIK